MPHTGVHAKMTSIFCVTFCHKWLISFKKHQIWPLFDDVLGGESKVHNSDKPHVTQHGRTTFVVIGPKGLNVYYSYVP